MEVSDLRTTKGHGRTWMDRSKNQWVYGLHTNEGVGELCFNGHKWWWYKFLQRWRKVVPWC